MKKMQSTELSVDHFTTRVKSISEKAEQFKNDPENKVSDLIDKWGHQYVDLVQEGGGVLGIALVGYTYIMEKAGVRFFSLAGTSAGAINTLLLASLGKIHEPKSEKVLEYLVDKNLFDIVDGDAAIKRFIQSYLDGDVKWIRGRTIYLIIKALLILFCRLGINPGKDFKDWITSILSENNIKNTRDLLDLRSQLPELATRNGVGIDDLVPRLVIVASDLTTQTKVHFPEMADLYWENVDEINPAKYLRASMSIPLFFKPFKINNIPQNANAKKHWFDKVRYKGKLLPQKVRMVDGGLLSNFPINVFHNEKIVPRLPTFGVRLSAFRETLNKTQNLIPYLMAMIKTMRHLYDTDFLLKHKDYRWLICRLDTDNKYNWLNFNMNPDDKLGLFEMGAAGAMKFLETFNWEEYKNERKELYKING